MKNFHLYRHNVNYLSSGHYKNDNFERKKHPTNMKFEILNIESNT
jgi:hypothetical protein